MLIAILNDRVFVYCLRIAHVISFPVLLLFDETLCQTMTSFCQTTLNCCQTMVRGRQIMTGLASTSGYSQKTHNETWCK